MSRLHAVVMCGGRGERFWPLSRRALPKQFVNLFGNRSLTQATAERVSRLCPPSRRWYVAPAEFRTLLQRQLKVTDRNLLLEVVGRNTAPAIGLAAAHLSRHDPDSTMLVLPADHLVSPRAAFGRAARFAAEVAQDGRLVTFGVPPTRADTGYGYIETGKRLAAGRGLIAFVARSFREKPDTATARRYVRSGRFLWNSGMFVWRTDAILAAFERYLPGFRVELDRYAAAIGRRGKAAARRRLYERAPAISIDYAVMEKADNVAVVRAPFQWDDVGSWLALERHGRQDRRANVTRGRVFLQDVDRTIVDTDTGVVGAVGVRDLVVVRAGEALLVAHRDRLADIRKLLRLLAKDRVGRSQL